MSGVQKPDFVIVGVNYQDGVMVFASDSLTEAQLETKVTELDELPTFQGKMRPSGVAHTVTVKSNDFKTATGRTYAEAMSNLFHQWHPRERDHRSIHDRMPKAMPSLYRGALR